MYEIINSKYLIKKYLPEFYNLLVKRGYNRWDKLDKRIDKQIESKENVKTNLIRLLLEIESTNNIELKAFTYLINEIIKRVLSAIPLKEKRIWEAFNGKFDNIEDWNYLNPIGEISALNKVLQTDNFDLLEIEAIFPNGKTKDYLFQRKKDKIELYVEVVNIHLPFGERDYNKIKEMIIEKLNRKVIDEIANVNDDKILKNLCFFPIVWFLANDIITNEYEFFSNFKKTYGSKYGIKHYSMGICTYIKIDGKYEFAEASSIYEKNKDIIL